MALRLNVANSIVDYLKSKGQASDFGTRRDLYGKQGLEPTFGSFAGSASQNTALLKKLRDAETAVAPVVPAPVAEATEPTPVAPVPQETYQPPDPLAEAVARRRSAIENAGAQYAPEFKQSQEDYTSELLRGAGQLPADVAARQATGTAATAEERRKEIAARLAAESNLGGRGITSTSGIAQGAFGEVARAGEAGRAGVGARTTADIQKILSEGEKQYGTDFIKALGIPEAESYAKLPASVRGTLAKAFEREQETIQGKVLGEANRLQNEARQLENDVVARGEKGAQSEERLLNMRLKMKKGETFTFNGVETTGLKDDDPDIQVIQQTDNQGNTTVVGLDKRTGQELYKQVYQGVGKAAKKAAGGGGGGGRGVAGSFTPSERRTLQRVNITDTDAGQFFLSAPAAFRTFFATNMKPGGAPSRREDVEETLRWWERNVKKQVSGKEILYESDTKRYFTDGTSEPK